MTRRDDLATFPVTVTITLGTPRRGIFGRTLGRVKWRTAVPLPITLDPEGMTAAGDAIVRATIDEDALATDLEARTARAFAAFDSPDK